MPTNTVFDVPVVPVLEDLLLDVRRGVLRIPRFQRPFVWDDEQRLLLIDSVAKGFSIGSLLVWRTHESLKSYDSLGGHKIDVSENVSSQYSTYVMDGHQRIVTLYTALMVNPETETAESEEQKRPLLPIYAVPPESDSDGSLDAQKTHFELWRKKGAPPETWVPLWFLFDEDRLDEHTDAKKSAGQREMVGWIKTLAKIFRRYPIPLVPYFATSRELVAESFTRLNMSSQKMDELHIAHALLMHGQSATDSAEDEEYDLLETIEKIKRELLLEEWGEVDERTLVNALKIRWRIPLHGTDPRDLTESFRKYRGQLDDLGEQCRRAIGWLRRLGVSRAEWLPYAYHFVGLVEIAEKHEEELSTEQLEAVRAWFWVTTFSEAFTGRRENNIRQELATLLEWVDNPEESKKAPTQPGNIVQPIKAFQMRWVRSRAMLLLMQENRFPPDDGGLYKTPPSTRAEILLPRRLRASNPAAYVVVNDLKDLEAVRGYVEGNAGRISESQEEEKERACLKEHLISKYAIAAARARQWDQFLELRLSELHELERERVREVGLSYYDEEALEW